MGMLPAPVGLVLAAARALASRAWRSAAVWTVGVVVWARMGVVMRRVLMRRGRGMGAPFLDGENCNGVREVCGGWERHNTDLHLGHRSKTGNNKGEIQGSLHYALKRFGRDDVLSGEV